jgi:serine/threonine protein kinase
LSVEDARPIVQQMAAALSAAHAADVIHRDFKTNNVMLLDAGPSRPPRVVVTDFGLAHLVGDASGMADGGITVTGDIPGTPEYMSPEQIEGGVLTPASDIYALGIVIYEMVTGRRPFAADTPIATALQRVVGPTPKSPRELKPELPAEWDHAIMRCLARYPDGRFRDASDVAHALDGTLPSRPPQSRLVIAAAVALLVVDGSRRTALARTKHVAGDRAIRSGRQRLRYRPRRSDRQLPCSGSGISRPRGRAVVINGAVGNADD